MANPHDQPTQTITKKHYRWVLFWMLILGLGLGVAGVGVTTEMVHWSGSTQFCSTACHNMTWVAEAYQRGAHAKTPSGVTAGCADCHIPYESSSPNPFQYVALLAYKAKAGARDVYHTALGTISTEQKWEANRERLSTGVEEWMVSNKFMTCRGCHDLEKMSGKNNPMTVELHASILKQDGFNCLQCHQGVGHAYKEKTAHAPATGTLAATQP
ncbi:MAG: NapC/NirT family cytochrome c [Burkholderiaceae bacterium]